MQEMQEMWVRSLGWEDPLEEGMAAPSSILAWKIPRTEEPGGMQSTGSQRVGHDWSDPACFVFQYYVILILLHRFLLYKHLFLVPYCCKSCHEDLVLEPTFSSVSSIASDSWPQGLQHTKHPCPSPTPGLCSNACHRVGDAIQHSHPLSSPSPPAFSLS